MEVLERKKLTVVRKSEEEKEKLRRRYTDKKMGKEQGGIPQDAHKDLLAAMARQRKKEDEQDRERERRETAIMGTATVTKTQLEDDNEEHNDMEVAAEEVEIIQVAEETEPQKDDKQDDAVEKDEDKANDDSESKQAAEGTKEADDGDDKAVNEETADRIKDVKDGETVQAKVGREEEEEEDTAKEEPDETRAEGLEDGVLADEEDEGTETPQTSQGIAKEIAQISTEHTLTQQEKARKTTLRRSPFRTRRGRQRGAPTLMRRR